MKIRLALKDPDGVYDSVKKEVEKSLQEIGGLTDEERGDLRESRIAGVWADLEQFIGYKESITVEIDTETGVAIALPV